MDVPCHPSGFFLICSPCLDLEVFSPLPLLSSSPHFPCVSRLHLSLGSSPLCKVHAFLSWEPPSRALAEILAISPHPSTSSCLDLLLTGVSLLGSQQLCKEKRGMGRGQKLRTMGAFEWEEGLLVPIITPSFPTEPGIWGGGTTLCGTPLFILCPSVMLGSLPGPQKHQAPHYVWGFLKLFFLPRMLFSLYPLNLVNFSSLKFLIMPLPWRGCTVSSPPHSLLLTHSGPCI